MFPRKAACVREPLSTEQRIAICLWRLGTNVEYRTISHLFGVGVSTVCVVLHDFCCAVVIHMAAKYIKVPTGPQLRKITDGFYTKWGFPHCIGAIDGSHIPIIAPKENPPDYYNRKGYHSVLLQALIDHEYRFLDVYVGFYTLCMNDINLLSFSSSLCILSFELHHSFIKLNPHLLLS